MLNAPFSLAGLLGALMVKPPMPWQGAFTQRTNSKANAKRKIKRAIGSRQERRSRCAGYAHKADALLAAESALAG